MVQIKTIFTALLGLTIVSCTPLVQRNAATVLSDLATISSDLTTLNTAVQAYAGGVPDALTIANDENILDTAINQATTDTNASSAFTPTESTNIVNAVAALTPRIVSGLSLIASKASLFAASGLTSLVHDLLTTLKTDTDALGAALQAKAQASDVPTLQGYQTQIDAAFVSAIAAY